MSASASPIEPSARERRAFVWMKLHSLTGVVPVGAFLVHHIWANAHALQGRAGYDAAMAAGTEHPHAVWVELLVVALPFAFHALFGVLLTLRARPSLRVHRSARYTGYVLQRLTGLVVLAFVVFHVVELRLAPGASALAPTDRFPQLCALFSNTVGGVPVRAILYLLGLAAASYHLTNGLRGFCSGWGLVASRRAGRIVGGAAAAGGLLIFALGASTVIYFSTGLRLVVDIGPHEALQPCLQCADALPTATPAPGASLVPAGAPTPGTATPQPEARP